MLSKGSPEIRRIFERIRNFCHSHADETIVAKYSKYFREGEGYDAYGVKREDMSTEVKSILAEHRESIGLGGFLDLGDLLLDSGKYEEAGFAISLITSFKKEFNPQVFERAGSWFEGKVTNWAISDVFCGDILSPMLSQGVVGLEDFAPWKESSNRWKRRAVPVSMLALLKTPSIRKAGPSRTAVPEVPPTTPTTPLVSDLLNFIRSLMLDKERVVHQGLGWFLREAWKKDPAEVEGFLMEFKETAARLIFQYATEKMTPEQKERFRKTRKTQA